MRSRLSKRRPFAEALEAVVLCFLDLHGAHPRAGRALRAGGDERLQVPWLTRREQLHPAVPAVTHPPRESAAARLLHGPPAIAHALHAAFDAEPDRASRHGSPERA